MLRSTKSLAAWDAPISQAQLNQVSLRLNQLQIVPTCVVRGFIMRPYCVFALYFVLACAAQGARAQEEPKPNQPPAALLAAGQTSEPPPATLLFPEGTPVKLKLLHPLNSKTVVVDDPLNFALAEDLIVAGKVAVRAGAAAIGQVRQVRPARMLGRGGQLSLEIQYMKVGSVWVPLRGSQAQSGANKKGDTVALVVLFGLSGLVKHGSEIVVKEGSIFTAYVDQDTELPPQPETTTPVT
jgi:hypothetical protein